MLHVLPYTSRQDKVARAHEVLPYAAAGNMRLVNSDLSRAWLDQLPGFELCPNDDAVDATVAAVKRWATRTPGQIGVAELWDGLRS